MFWMTAGAVVVVLVALAWWSSGPKRRGILNRRSVSQQRVDIGRSGHQAQHNTQFGPPGGSAN